MLPYLTLFIFNMLLFLSVYVNFVEHSFVLNFTSSVHKNSLHLIYILSYKY